MNSLTKSEARTKNLKTMPKVSADHANYIRDHMQVHQTNKLTYLRVLGDHAEVNGNQLRRKSFRNCKIEQRVSTRA